MKAGELWSLSDRRIVVVLTERWRGVPIWDALVVDADAGSGFRVGDGAVVRPEALSQRWTVKPLTGVAREVSAVRGADRA